ncbi:single-stranded DNA-binding protein [Paenibacillus pectinilyticus]|uniref:Single-stranded DNA-binding protein n=2 Tax=Paenibacillus pectinilyticus TaxID=512399 RepID=A0A1C0ZWW3_9BACL|nr:single-stranded DNA-binding protein [Paenibacillus pectinilyticus]OCT12604.1 single-stranded DNA-binding protein [Paenibacillus pectinilyticus]
MLQKHQNKFSNSDKTSYNYQGVAVFTFTLAVDRPFSGNDGKKEADFINIVAWRQLAETCANYLRKGRLTAIEGRIQVRNYDNNEGKRVYVTEVIADNVRFLESNGGGKEKEESKQQDPFKDDGKPIDISDDDLPF